MISSSIKHGHQVISLPQVYSPPIYLCRNTLLGSGIQLAREILHCSLGIKILFKTQPSEMRIEERCPRRYVREFHFRITEFFPLRDRSLTDILHPQMTGITRSESKIADLAPGGSRWSPGP